MCGIAGFFEFQTGAERLQAERSLSKMTLTLSHRGPDNQGFWSDSEAGIFLGHRRLSVIDVSMNGAQPMVSVSGRYVISINCEIYNYKDIRDRVEQAQPDLRWRGSSDTEVLLAAIECFGITESLQMADGMFAAAIWDKSSRTLTLARDRFGEKPLYYGWVGSKFVFASEVRAIRSLVEFKAPVRIGAVEDYLRYSYVPGPETIYQGIFKLDPASTLEVSANAPIGSIIQPEVYWDKREAAFASMEMPFSGDFDAAIAEFEQQFAGVISNTMVSDVPLGSLLSGGIDSSLVTAFMQSGSANPVKTFSIGSDDSEFDESKHAQKVAKHLGTDHTSLILSPADIQAAIPDMATVYDEPFADSSQIPTYLVSKLAREQVTVALTGDGGDEVFWGYNRYIHGPGYWNKLSKIPSFAKSVGKLALETVPTNLLVKAGNLITSNSEVNAGRGVEKLQKAIGLLGASDEVEFHEALLAASANRQILSNDGALPMAKRGVNLAPHLSLCEKMVVTDVENYLPDDILVKVDRASMAVALETRAPFLSRSLYEFSWSLPVEYKIDQGKGKRILREALYKRVPKELVDRPKAGFAIPIGRWLRSELNEWSGDLLMSRDTKLGQFVDQAAVSILWHEHQKGSVNHENTLWSLLMLEGWLNEVSSASV